MTRQEAPPISHLSKPAIEAGIPSSEKLPSPERPRLKLIKSIALTGPESAGKGEVLEILRKRHGWKKFDGSEIGFERKGKNAEKGHIKRTAKQHKAMDKRQARIFRNLTPDGEQLIAEAKLSGIILAEQKDVREDQIEKIEKQNRPRIQDGRDPIEAPEPIPAVSINLWASKEVRVGRALAQKLIEYENLMDDFKHQMEAYELQQQGILNGERIPKHKLLPEPVKPIKPTRDSVDKMMEERQKRDVEDWAPLHPNYIRIGENPYSRTLERPKDRGLVYDRWIDTSKLTPEEVADKFEEFAIELGAAAPLTLREHEALARGIEINELPTSGDIFDSEKIEEKDSRKTEEKSKENEGEEEEFENKKLEQNRKSRSRRTKNRGNYGGKSSKKKMQERKASTSSKN